MFKKITFSTIVFTIIFLLSSSSMAMEVDAVIDNMNKILKPQETLLRDITIEIRTQEELARKWEGCQVRKTTPEGQSSLLLINEPARLNGIAVLFYEPADYTADKKTWIYLPSLNRVQKIQNPMGFESFLNSDFTYVDLGLFDVEMTHELLPSLPDHFDKKEKEDVFVLQSKPERDFYYSKIITLISTKTFMPQKKYYYSKAGDLWKTLSITEVEFDEQNRLLELKMTMTNHFDDTITAYIVNSTAIGADIPDKHLKPANLRNLSASNICRQ